MSGPTAQVLLRTRLSTKEIDQLEAFVRSSSGSTDWKDFYLLGQPFTMALNDPDDEEEQFELAGWQPAQSLSVECHCRGRAGDFLLAFIVARVAEMFSGLIVLGESLESLTADASVLSLEGRHRSAELGDVLTPECMNYWAASPEFRMSN